MSVGLKIDQFKRSEAGAVRRRVSDRLKEGLSVKDFGALGDGVTNDAAAIISAIAAAVASSTPLYIPAGTYYTGSTPITTPATSGGKLRIFGAGKGLTRITRLAGSATNTLTISLTGASAVEISDLTIDGPTGLGFDNASFGISWVHANLSRRFCARRVEITGTHDHCIVISGGGNVEVIDCELRATDAVVACFQPLDTENPGLFVARGGIWQTPDGDMTTGGSVGLYIHPHYPYLVSDVTFSTMGRYAIYENGTTVSMRTPSIVSNCRFIDCEMAQTKTRGITNFVGCTASGSTSGIGSSLGGTVNIIGGMYDKAFLNTAPDALDTNVTITGATLIDTRVLCGTTSNQRWKVRSCTFIVTDGSPWTNAALLYVGDGIVDLTDTSFEDYSTTVVYQGFVHMTTGTTPTLRAKGSRFIGGRGTLSSGIYCDRAGASADIDSCEFDAGATTYAVRMTSTVAAGAFDGRNNQFRNGALIIQFGASNQQRFVRKSGINPSTLASAISIDTATTAFFNYDTHVVTGSAAITNLTLPQYCVGIIRLVVAAGATWSTANTGNITPLTTAARTPGTVVSLLWEPTAAKWLEV